MGRKSLGIKIIAAAAVITSAALTPERAEAAWYRGCVGVYICEYGGGDWCAVTTGLPFVSCQLNSEDCGANLGSIYCSNEES